MIAAYLIDAARRQYPLEELLEQEGIEAVVEGADGTRRATPSACARWPRLQRAGARPPRLRRLFEDVELPLVEVLCRMERQGVKLDVERLGELAANVADEVAAARARDLRAGRRGVHDRLAAAAQPRPFREARLSRKRRGKTGFSTDARVLAAIRDEHEIVAKVEAWRELSKLKSTYLDALPELISPETGRLHTTFNQAATTTGRLSSTNPNLQNIPIRTELGRKIRRCFVAEPGHAADLGRLLAGRAADPRPRRGRGRAEADLRAGRGRARRDRGRGA